MIILDRCSGEQDINELAIFGQTLSLIAAQKTLRAGNFRDFFQLFLLS